jgi:hypothetical protein
VNNRKVGNPVVFGGVRFGKNKKFVSFFFLGKTLIMLIIRKVEEGLRDATLGMGLL